jgi:hypothetical protein
VHNGNRHVQKMRTKVTNQKYGKFPAKQAEENSWDTAAAGLSAGASQC